MIYAEHRAHYAKECVRLKGADKQERRSVVHALMVYLSRELDRLWHRGPVGAPTYDRLAREARQETQEVLNLLGIQDELSEGEKDQLCTDVCERCGNIRPCPFSVAVGWDQKDNRPACIRACRECEDALSAEEAEARNIA